MARKDNAAALTIGRHASKSHGRKPWWLAALTGSAIALSSCKSEHSGNEEVAPLDSVQEEACVSKSTQAVGLLMERLSTQLKAALSAGGPENAVTVCQQVAQPLTAATSGELDGLTISRTSLRVRNPKNAPDPVDRKVLEAWHELVDSKQTLPDHELIPLSGDRAVFYKPIMTQAVCLRCHGPADTFSPELIELLDQTYPQDQAIGYKEGDLRGAFRVMIDLNAVESAD